MKKEILQQLKPDNIPTQNQVDLLAQFLIENFEDEIGKGESPNGEGAIEMAVRLLFKLKKQNHNHQKQEDEKRKIKHKKLV